MQTGESANYFCEPTTLNELKKCLKFADKNNFKTFILGEGSNTVFSDEGFNGIVIRPCLKGIKKLSTQSSTKNEGCFEVFCGEKWDDFVSYSVDNNFAGIECLAGIPGLVGAVPIQNIGAYGQEVKDTILKVTTLHKKTLKKRVFTNSQCEFSYRNSIFKTKNDYIILSVVFKLKHKGNPTLKYKELKDSFTNKQPTLKQVQKKVLEIRKQKSMIYDKKDKNSIGAGSFFKNPIVSKEKYNKLCRKLNKDIPSWEVEGLVKIPAAWLIEQAGFNKGYIYKNIGLSEKHALVVINRKNGTTKQIVELVQLIQTEIFNKYEIKLYPEVNLVDT